MPILASLACGFIFGMGLLVSGLTQPAKVLAFLDILGAWDPSLAVLMATALIVSYVGFRLVRQRPRPVFAPQSLWPTRSDIDGPLVAGSALFGIGWGLAGFCPGPAVAALSTGAIPVLVFVAAMLVGMAAHARLGAREGAGARSP